MFRPQSIVLTSSLSSVEKKEQGIFFTPSPIRKHFMDFLGKLSSHTATDGSAVNPQTFLEPSMGSGEFVLDILQSFPNALITGVEKNKTLFESTRQTLTDTSVELIHTDFLDNTRIPEVSSYDVIIGNPPYFQVKEGKSNFKKIYPELEGKFDIYVLFLLKCLRLLNPDGHLLFVLPKTFVNTKSYHRVRRLVATRFRICELIDFGSGDWLSTKQNTIGLLLQNTPSNNSDFMFEFPFGGNLIVNTKYAIAALKSVYSCFPTIHSKGFTVRTGEIICTSTTYKHKMTSTPKSSALLVHNSQIRNFGFLPNVPKGSKRPLYIDVEHSHITQPVIAVNRGNGNNGVFRFECCWLNPSDYEFPLVAENHIYKIYDNGLNELASLFQSLKDPRVIDFLGHCCGNGMMTKELLLNIPIFQ